MATRLQGIDLFDPDMFAGGPPHETFALLRREAPVYRNLRLDAPPFWAVTRHQDVVSVSRDWTTFSSERHGVLLREPPDDAMETMRLLLLNMDPPRHTKVRALVNKGFTPRQVERLTEPIRRICAEIIDAVGERGECDFVTEVAAELPLQVIAEMLGVPQEDRHQLFEWSNAMIGSDDPDWRRSPEEGQAAAFAMYAYANELALARKGSPRDDLVSVLMRAEIDGEQLTEMEFDVFFLLSDNRWSYRDLEHPRAIVGYEPLDRAEDHRVRLRA